MLRVTKNGNAPVERRARQGKIAQAARYEGAHLVQAFAWLHEVRVALVEFEQLVRVVRQAKEVAFLLHPFDRRALRTVARAVALLGLAFVVVGFVANRVPALVASLVDIPVRFQPFPEALAGFAMARFRRADEIIVRCTHRVAHLAEHGRVAVR